jgi:hypothetical protein
LAPACSPVQKTGGELLPWHEEFNTFVNSLRASVERAIANVKTWRILHTDLPASLSSRKGVRHGARGVLGRPAFLGPGRSCERVGLSRVA